jgi:hypothetical protein
MGRVMTPAAAALKAEIVEAVRGELAHGRLPDRHAIARQFEGRAATCYSDSSGPRGSRYRPKLRTL